MKGIKRAILIGISILFLLLCVFAIVAPDKPNFLAPDSIPRVNSMVAGAVDYTDRKWRLLPDSIKRIVKERGLVVLFMPPYRSLEYSETFKVKDYEVSCHSQVDTTEIVIGFHTTDGKESILIGYNHLYDFTLINQRTKEEVTFRVNKKRDLSFLKDSEWWEISNLNPWTFLTYNEKYQKFVFSFNINPWSNWGEIYYFVFDKQGDIDFHGFDKGWGGSGEDGEMHIDEDYIVSCNEVYRFRDNSKQSFIDIALLKGYNIFAMRMLGDSAVLVIFYKSVGTPDENGSHYTADNIENAYIFSLDGKILKQFRFYDFFEEMDFEFHANDTYSADTLMYFDSRRGKLGFVQKKPPYNVSEIGLEQMTEVTKNEELKFKAMKLILEGWDPPFEVRVSATGRFFYKMSIL